MSPVVSVVVVIVGAMCCAMSMVVMGMSIVVPVGSEMLICVVYGSDNGWLGVDPGRSWPVLVLGRLGPADHGALGVGSAETSGMEHDIGWVLDFSTCISKEDNVLSEELSETKDFKNVVFCYVNDIIL